MKVLGEFFMLTLVYNLGGAMGTNFGSSMYYLIVSLLLTPFILYYIYSYREYRRLSLPLAFIAGGAIGNIVDRLRLGRVVDFLDFDFFDIDLFGFQLTRWWTFNVADMAITGGILFLAAITLFGGVPSPASSKQAGSEPDRPAPVDK